MLKQLDLNVNKPESQRLPERYPGDSINSTMIRLHFDEEDEPAVMQLVKDHRLFPCIWSWPPPKSHLSTPWWKKISNRLYFRFRAWPRLIKLFDIEPLKYGN